MARKKPVTLNDREIEGLAYMFAVWFAALVLAPGNNRDVRGLFQTFGLLKSRGPLALTKAGERIMAFCRDDGRPKYRARKERKR